MAGRKRAILFAYGANGFAKAIGFVAQMLVLPVAARILGADKLGYMLSLAAALSFPLIAVAGFSPAASLLMSREQGQGDGNIGDIFWALLGRSLIIGLAFAAIFLAICQYYDFGGERAGLAPAQLKPLYFFAAAFLLISYLAATVDGARAAMRQSHYSNFYAAAGSLITMSSAAIFALKGANISAIFASMFLAQVTVQLLNLLHFYVQHRSKLGRPHWVVDHEGHIKKTLLGNVEAQGGMVLYVHGTTFLLGRFAGFEAAALLGAFVRLAIMLHSMLASLFAPVLAMVSQAKGSGDAAWTGKSIRGLLSMAALALSVLFLVFSFGGWWIKDGFLKLSGQPAPYFYPACASFLFIYSATHLLYLTRLAACEGKHRGARILAAASLGFIAGAAGLATNVALFLGLQAILMALLASLTYLRQVLRVAVKLNISRQRSEG
jgi:magnesium-transporting ATPase (P-type)